jgi:hypothetical protein
MSFLALLAYLETHKEPKVIRRRTDYVKGLRVERKQLSTVGVC